MLLMLLPFGGAAAAAAAATGAVSSNCTRICGNISIPYPFGIESGCYHAGGGFNLTCNHSFHPPELFLGDGTVQVLDISIEDSTVRINSTGVELSYFDDPNYGQNATRTWGTGLPRNGPYFLSESTNMLQAIGCGIQVSILGGENNSSLSSCTSLCPSLDLAQPRSVGNGSCSGIACCQASIVLGLSHYTIQINTIAGFSPPIGTAPSVYIVDQIYHYDWALFYGEDRPHALPATLDWIVNNSRCPTNMITAPECRSTHSYCQDFGGEAHGGYMCKCSQGYHGNPYIPGGCQDIDECKYPDTYICYGQCKNTPGSFICQCNTGYTGDSSHPNGCKDFCLLCLATCGGDVWWFWHMEQSLRAGVDATTLFPTLPLVDLPASVFSGSSLPPLVDLPSPPSPPVPRQPPTAPRAPAVDGPSVGGSC